MAWKKQEIEYLKGNYRLSSITSISKFLGKSPIAIRIKAHRLNLTKKIDIELTEIEEQVIIGGLLGDLHCRKTHTSKNCRLEGGHCMNQKEYLTFKMNLLKRLDWISWPSTQGTYHYQSKSFACLNKYYNYFYNFNKKTINASALNKLNKLGLLIWYLDDGSYSIRDKNLSIYTNSFSYNDNETVKSWFSDRWNIYPKLCSCKDPKRHPGKIWHFLRFSVKESQKLIELFQGLDIPQCMQYKVPLIK